MIPQCTLSEPVTDSTTLTLDVSGNARLRCERREQPPSGRSKIDGCGAAASDPVEWLSGLAFRPARHDSLRTYCAYFCGLRVDSLWTKVQSAWGYPCGRIVDNATNAFCPTCREKLSRCLCDSVGSEAESEQAS